MCTPLLSSTKPLYLVSVFFDQERVPYANLEEIEMALERYQKLAQLAERVFKVEAMSEQFEAIAEELGQETTSEIVDLVLSERDAEGSKVWKRSVIGEKIEEELKVGHEQNGKKEVDKDAEELKEHLSKLGEFRGKIDINLEQESFTKVQVITRWDLLMYRYKPQYMPQIKKAI